MESPLSRQRGHKSYQHGLPVLFEMLYGPELPVQCWLGRSYGRPRLFWNGTWRSGEHPWTSELQVGNWIEVHLPVLYEHWPPSFDYRRCFAGRAYLLGCLYKRKHTLTALSKNWTFFFKDICAVFLQVPFKSLRKSSFLLIF